MMILAPMVLALMACESSGAPGQGRPSAYPTFPPLSLSGYDQEAAYAAAQATLASGQSVMMELSHQATMVSLNLYQAADAAVQTTMDYNQRQLMELSIRGTEVSQYMIWAAATQQFITEQTQMASNAAATAQSHGTAQAQAMLDVQASHTAQANATQTAYSLTATPLAAIQADILRTRNEAGRRALWGEFVVTPLKESS